MAAIPTLPVVMYDENETIVASTPAGYWQALWDGFQVSGPVPPPARSEVPAHLSDLDTVEAKIQAAPRLPVSQRVKNRVDAAVMSTPPTLSASGTPTLATGIAVPSPKIRISGAPQYVTGGASLPRGATNLDGTQNTFGAGWQVSFQFDGQAFEFRTTPRADTKFLVWVDDRPHAASPAQLTSATGAVSGTPTWLKVDFGSRANRRIMIEFSGGNSTNFNTLNVAATDSVMQPFAPSPRMAWVGDSIAYGIGASNYRNAYSIKTAWLLGIDDVFNSTAQPSSGLVKAVSANLGNYASRFTADVLPLAPDIIVIQGSVNDNGQTGVDAALTSYVATVRAALPNARLVVTSPIYAGTPLAGYLAVRDAMKPTAEALGLPFIDTMQSGQEVFYGTGRVGATTGNGNADYYRESDVVNTHPSDAGHDYLARWMAPKLAVALGISLG